MAGGNVSIVALGEKNVAGSVNLSIVGSDVTGENVLLAAPATCTFLARRRLRPNHQPTRTAAGRSASACPIAAAVAGRTPPYSRVRKLQFQLVMAPHLEHLWIQSLILI
ncbi:hypothetical protein [Achromobacter sp. JD417]|uniref:hypothetical protein n=1 Tax=Achromobacter sp. JD417 TaxID=2893881 RepID=UPI0035A582A1